MLYLDHASTSFPKERRVVEAVRAALEDPGVAPGRGQSARGRAAAKIVDLARRRVAALLAVASPERVTFTLNATDALNLAIKGVVRPGDAVVTTQAEHNSVTRPLHGLALRSGVIVHAVPAGRDGVVATAEVMRRVTARTRLVAIAHASNVTGALQSVAEVGRALRATVAIGPTRPLLLVDVAQSAGYRPLDEVSEFADLLAGSGHKGPGGPLGTGFLWVRPGIAVLPQREGGTGSNSESPLQPDDDPGALEAGSPNLPGIAGLSEALRIRLEEDSLAAVATRRAAATVEFAARLRELVAVETYGPAAASGREPVFALRVRGWSVAEAALVLEREFGIEQRAGLHCAPGVHAALGTAPDGTLRFSFGSHPRDEEITQAVAALRGLATAAPGHS